jgi:hypothetical protein
MNLLHKIRVRLERIFWRELACIFLGKRKIGQQELLPFSLMVMSGRKIHKMSIQMVCSFCRAWSAMPASVIVVSDGTRSSDKIKKDFNFFKGNVVVSDWRTCASEYSEPFTDFAERSIYGRKFISMLFYAKRSPILFCDSDVLWFSALKNFPVGKGMKLCEDYERSYNEELIAKMGWEERLNGSPMNVGVVYLSGDIVAENEWVQDAVCYLASPYKFPEQTILAAANAGRPVWSINDIGIRLNDYSERMTLEGCPFAARHYVSGGKIKFWKDSVILNRKK